MSHQISHSRVEGYLLCERRDYYGYTLRLKRKKESISLGLGTATHTCLKALYETVLKLGKSAKAQRAAWDRAVEAMWAQYHQLVADGWSDDDPQRWPLKDILEHYLAQERLVLAGWRILAVEKEFHVRWNDEGDTILFIVDLIAADPAGRVYVIDHKTVWDFITDTEARLMPQLPKYVGMLRFLGYNIHGAAYNMPRSRKINGGKMLKPELIRALYDHYGGGPGDDAPPLEKKTVAQLQELCETAGIEAITPPEPEKLYRWLPVPLSDERVRRTLYEQFTVAGDITQRTDSLTAEQIDKIAVRTASKMVCRMCSFREICTAELNGEDTRLVLETFTERDPRELPELDGEDDV